MKEINDVTGDGLLQSLNRFGTCWEYWITPLPVAIWDCFKFLIGSLRCLRSCDWLKWLLCFWFRDTPLTIALSQLSLVHTCDITDNDVSTGRYVGMSLVWTRLCWFCFQGWRHCNWKNSSWVLRGPSMQRCIIQRSTLLPTSAVFIREPRDERRAGRTW